MEGFRILALFAAFGIALCGYGRRAGRGRSRFVLGLHAGTLLAFVGLELLLDPLAVGEPRRLLRFEGASVLFLPLGVLLVAPFRESLSALPLALFAARLGCLPYGCCYEVGWRALPELAGLLALRVAANRWPRHTTPIVLCGFGAIRLLCSSLRTDLTPAPCIDPAWIAFAWILAGVGLRHRIGSAETAREWFPRRTEPLLRALALMLVVWLLVPLAACAFEEPSMALLSGSAAALALLLAVRRPRVAILTVGSAGVFAGTLLLGMAVAAVAVQAARSQGFVAGARLDAGTAGVVALVAIGPAFEELLYRERLLSALRAVSGGSCALLVSSALFALGHLDPGTMPIAFAGGVVCGAVVIRTGSLAAAIGLHVGWNLAVVAPC